MPSSLKPVGRPVIHSTSREIAEDAADDGEAAGVELIGGGDPAHDFAGGAGESFIKGVVHALIGFGEPAGDLRFVFADDVDGAVGGTAVDDEVFEIGIVLGEDRVNRLLDVLGGVVDGRNKRNAGRVEGCRFEGLRLRSSWASAFGHAAIEQIKPIEVAVIVKFLVEGPTSNFAGASKPSSFSRSIPLAPRRARAIGNDTPVC